jgi:hypothetical protein
MTRRFLVLVLTAIIVALVIVSASSVAGAQPTGAPTPNYCADQPIKEWYIWGTPDTEAWWFYWVYNWCYQSETGWYKTYLYWDWWGPVG